MKFISILSLVLCSVSLNAQIVNIPDASFKNTLVSSICVDINNDNSPDVSADSNGDGELQLSEVLAVRNLYLQNNTLTSLNGLDNFINLEILNSFSSHLDSIDVHNLSNLTTLYSSYNPLTSLNLSGLQHLEKLGLSYSHLSVLDLSNLSALKSLTYWDVPATSIITQGLTSLETIDFSHVNLQSIDLHDSPNLKSFNCRNSQLVELNLENKNNLTSVNCYGNPMVFLQVRNSASLQTLECYNSQLNGLVLENLPALRNLDCSSNNLEMLDLRGLPSLNILSCSNNDLHSLYIKNGGSSFLLGTLNFAANPNLTYVCCDLVDSVMVQTGITNWQIANCIVDTNCGQLGTETVEAQETIQINPNPAQQFIYLPADVERIEVYDINARLCGTYSNSANQIAIENLHAGLYIAKLYAGDKIYYSKFIKE